MNLKMCADHADLLMAKNRKCSKVLFETDKSIVILDQSMPCLFVSCQDLSEMNELVKSIDLSKKYTIALHQKEAALWFDEWEIYLECVNLLYEKELPELIESPYPIRMLTNDDVRQASQLYRKMDFNAYVKHCIDRNAVYGMFDGKRLVAMIGEHDEEIMGLLEVHPDYRRRHLAMILETYMMHVQKAKGKPVVSQIKTDNEASFKLHEALGFAKGNEIVAWMRHRKRNV